MTLPELRERAQVAAEMLMQLGHAPAHDVPSPNSWEWEHLRRKLASTLLWTWTHEPDRAPVGPDASVVTLSREARRGLDALLRQARRELRDGVAEAAARAAHEEAP